MPYMNLRCSQALIDAMDSVAKRRRVSRGRLARKYLVERLRSDKLPKKIVEALQRPGNEASEG